MSLEAKNKKNDEIKVYAPLKGQIIPLNEVKDEVFADGLIGDGCAIYPEDAEVASPVDGVVKVLFPTKHAIGIETNDGVEILIHIGIDTVELNGEGFESFIKEGSKVKRGEKIISFQRSLFLEKGIDITTMIVVTDMKDYIQMNKTDAEVINKKEVLFSLTKE